MLLHKPQDAVVVGSGPNGLAAAIVLARAGLSVTVFEQSGSIGGGTRSMELTLPGFVHDICSAVHPLAASSPFFRSLPLHEHGLKWIYPEVQLAHPMPDGSAVVLYSDLEKTASELGVDGAGYKRLMTPLVRRWVELSPELLASVHIPRHPLQFALFGMTGLIPASLLGRLAFRTPAARALFAGLAAHSSLPLRSPLTSAFGLILGALAHIAGWPVAKGGSHAIAKATESYLKSLGGEILTGHKIRTQAELPPAKITILDITPRQLIAFCGQNLPQKYREKLEKYRYGPGVFKVDWALDGPIPWSAEGCRHAATVHVGGTAEELTEGERKVWRGIHPERPFVLVVQPTLFDTTRSPSGKHTGWAYCHVPNNSTVNMTERIETQIERFAPGFRKLILARHTMNCVEYESHNPNIIGGDINGGVQDIRQFLVRPKLLSPYRMPLHGLYLCSSGTPPGGGVHGMCGYQAAITALGDTGVKQ